jgi:hypothetical protein
MNKTLLALYGLKFNPFSPQLPTAALHITPPVSFRQGCMNSRPRPGTVGAPYLVIRRPHDVAVISRSR